MNLQLRWNLFRVQQSEEVELQHIRPVVSRASISEGAS
jgi:hypothetical protein